MSLESSYIGLSNIEVVHYRECLLIEVPTISGRLHLAC